MSTLHEGALASPEPATRELDTAGARRPVHVAAATHRGRVRENNEDSVLVCGWTACGSPSTSFTARVHTGQAPVCAVADGLGGHEGGEVASRLVVDFLAQSAARMVDEDAARSVVREADAMLAAEGLRSPDLRDMGSTVAGLVLQGARVLVFSVGDSSVWGVFDGRGRMLSRSDRPPRPVGFAGDRPVTALSQCLGGGTWGVEPHVLSVDVAPGDRYLITTDGLTDLVDPVDLVRDLHRPLVETADSLIERALGQGGHDNVSVIVIEIE